MKLEQSFPAKMPHMPDFISADGEFNTSHSLQGSLCAGVPYSPTPPPLHFCIFLLTVRSVTRDAVIDVVGWAQIL